MVAMKAVPAVPELSQGDMYIIGHGNVPRKDVGCPDDACAGVIRRGEEGVGVCGQGRGGLKWESCTGCQNVFYEGEHM
jgi:hypothetical protein